MHKSKIFFFDARPILQRKMLVNKWDSFLPWKKNEIFYVEHYSRYLATCVFWAKFYHSIFMKYLISNLIYLYAVKKNYPKTYLNVEYAYGNIREQVVWHLWSFTFLSVTNFLDSLSRTVGVPYHLYAELVRSKSSSI